MKMPALEFMIERYGNSCTIKTPAFVDEGSWNIKLVTEKQIYTFDNGNGVFECFVMMTIPLNRGRRIGIQS